MTEIINTQGGLSTREAINAGFFARRKTIFANSISGDDANDGLTAATAKQTVTAAVALMANGDTLRLARSSRWREWPDLSALSGCVIEAYGGGPRPIISARDVVSSFTIHNSGPAYTFTVDLIAVVPNRGYPGIFEDGRRLSEIIVGDPGVADAAAAIAAVEATPGTFYFAGPGTQSAGWDAGVKTYYVHASDGGDPGSNGRLYEVYKRQRAVLTGPNEWRDIVFNWGWQHDGMTGGGLAGSTLKRCAIVGHARHGSLFATLSADDLQVVQSNPRYPGGLIHCNPSVGLTASPHVLRNVTAYGDARDWAAQAFYTHGDFDQSTIEKEGWVVVGADVANVRTVIDVPDTGYFKGVRIRARNFDQITSGIPAMTELVDGNFVGGALTSEARAIRVRPGSRLSIRGGHYDIADRTFLTQTSGGNAGVLEISDATIILRGLAAASATHVFFRTEGASNTIEGLDLRRCRLVSPTPLQFSLAQAQSIAAINVEDLIMVGAVSASGNPRRDPIVRLAGVDTPLSTILPNARVTWQDPARVIETDADGEMTFRPGAYRPGDRIFSGCAYSVNGSQQPRTFVVVGDQIVTVTSAQAATVRVTAPPAHLNAVAFCQSGGTTRSFVVVGDAGTIYNSDINAQTYTLRTSGVSANLRAVAAHTDGVVVAVGDGGVIVRSTNSGETWAEVSPSGTTDRLRAIATDGTTWVAAGDGGRVGTSADGGASWTWATVGSAAHYALLWHSGLSLFFLGGDDGAIRTSPASVSWTTRTSGTEQRVVSFAQGPDGVMAALYQTRPHFGPSMIVSADGIAWEPNPTALPWDIRAICGSGTSIFENRSYLAVGETSHAAFGRTRREVFASRPVVYRPTLSRRIGQADQLAEVGL